MERLNSISKSSFIKTSLVARKEDISIDDFGTILHLRALQGHSGSIFIDPTLQDNEVIESGIFHYIYHVGCAFNLHSNQQWIDTWRSRFEQKTNSVLLAC